MTRAVEEGLDVAEERVTPTTQSSPTALALGGSSPTAARSVWPHYSTVGDAVYRMQQFRPSGARGLELTICCATPAAVLASPTHGHHRPRGHAHGHVSTSTKQKQVDDSHGGAQVNYFIIFNSFQ